MSKIEVVHIVACDLNGCIGNNGEIPWHLPADLKRFKELTSGGVVVMGRKTFESLDGNPLPNRVNIVITNDPKFQLKHKGKGVIFYNEISFAIQKAKYEAMVLGLKEVWIIGGQTIYEQTMPYVDRIEATLVFHNFKGDTFYPRNLPLKVVNNSESYIDTLSGLRYKYIIYKVTEEMSDNQEECSGSDFPDFLEISIPKGTVNLSRGTAGRKHDSNKPRYSLLPTGTINQVVQVLEYGAVKYEIDNWQRVPSARTRYYDAAMRHIDDWWNGSEIDEESSLHHLAHAICCLLFLLWFDEQE